MRAVDVRGFSEYVSGSRVEHDPLWSKELSAVSMMDIQLMYARSREHAPVARLAVDYLQSELLTQAIDGQVPVSDLRIIEHEVPPERHTVDEFTSKLLTLPLARRQAVLYALNSKMKPNEVAALEWRAVAQLSPTQSGVLHEILEERATVRHMRLPYVFWEFATDVIAAPLLKLKEDAEEAFGASWPTIQTMWTEVIWVSPRAEASALMSVVNEVRTGKL